MKLNIEISPKLTAIMTGHGKNKSYLHRFEIIDDPTCSCLKAAQTVDHLIYDCEKLQQPRRNLIDAIVKNGGTWPVLHEVIVQKCLGHFNKFIKSIDYNTV